jgi:Type IIA topoisomerase (DNA gyrase/topo II, topoisomerase IV), B subunit
LLELALEDARLVPGAGLNPVSGDELQALAARFLVSRSAQQALSKRYRPEIISAMQLYNPLEPRMCMDKEQIKRWFRGLCDEINERSETGCIAEVFSLAKTGEHGGRITLNIHGVEIINVFTPEFFSTKVYQELTGLLRAHVLTPGATMERGDQVISIDSIKKGFEWLLEKAASGLHVQRYKGLGEMNPDQLWETTMDANRRVLSRVRIEDAVAADEIFTTLMGDQVEPRREFIEKNALLAENLDT